MIELIKKEIEESFLNYISEEELFFEEWYWKWNKEKDEFTLSLTPDLYQKFSYIEKHIYWFDNYPWFLRRLSKLETLWVINRYDEIWHIDYSEEEYNILFEKNNIVIWNNFYNLYKDEWWEYIISVKYDKIKLFENILYNKNKIKLNINKQLLKNLLYLSEKEKTDFSLGNVQMKIFDMEIILDELDINDDKYIFNDFEVLLYSICSLSDKLYISRLLTYLLWKINWTDKDTLINTINSNKDIKYLDKNDSDDEAANLSNLYKNHLWDIYYNNLVNQPIKKINSKNITYNFKTWILEYSWKKVSFAQAKWQREIIAKLYENANCWVSEDDVWKKWQQILKDIWIKMKKKTWGWFTSLEIKQLFQTFEDNKKRYFIMIW